MGKMKSFLLALLGFVSPKNTPNEVTNQELLDKVNALTLELNEVKKAQTQSNVHFLAMISESGGGYNRHTGGFTVPQDGLYVFTVNFLTINDAPSGLQIDIDSVR